MAKPRLEVLWLLSVPGTIASGLAGPIEVALSLSEDIERTRKKALETLRRSDVQKLEGALRQKREASEVWCDQLKGFVADLNRISRGLQKLRTAARAAAPVRPVRRASARRTDIEG